MLRIVACKGLPGSGKTTWARELVRGRRTWNKHDGVVEYEEGPAPRFVRVNRDEIRRMMFGDQPWTREHENAVVKVRNAAIIAGLQLGCSVVSDDMNLDPRHLDTFETIAQAFDVLVEVEVNDSFLAVSLEECIRRQAFRAVADRVPEREIRKVYDRWLAERPPGSDGRSVP
jgi:predicted kinase